MKWKKYLFTVISVAHDRTSSLVSDTQDDAQDSSWGGHGFHLQGAGERRARVLVQLEGTHTPRRGLPFRGPAHVGPSGTHSWRPVTSSGARLLRAVQAERAFELERGASRLALLR